MKTIFFLTNLIGGVLVFLLGLAVVLIQTRSPAAMAVGVVAAGLGAVCVWLAKECVSAGPGPMAQANRPA